MPQRHTPEHNRMGRQRQGNTIGRGEEELEDKEKLQLISDMLRLTEEETNPELPLKELNNWDSVSVMMLVVTLRKNGFKQSMDAGQISKLNTIQDIMQLMSH